MRPSVLSRIVFLVFVGCTWPVPAPLYATDSDGLIAETDRFSFYSNIWINLHHFLYNYALNSQQGSVDPDYTRVVASLSEDQARIFKNAVNFYVKELIEQDLRIGEKNYYIKRWIASQSITDSLRPIPNVAGYATVINPFRETYAQFFWPDHARANSEVVRENLPIIRAIELDAVAQLQALTRASWQSAKIRVDVSYHSKRDRPYATTRPVPHIVMDSSRNSLPRGNWVELLFHEASHDLISEKSGYVGETIIAAGKLLGKPAPRQLSHAYLFYFSGKVIQELMRAQGLSDYELYMVRNRVFEWSYPVFELHLRDYLTTQEGLEPATEIVILEASNLR